MVTSSSHAKLYSYYTTYERMDTLFGNILPIRRKTPNTINIFIDSQNALHYLGRKHYGIYNPLELLATLLNMSAHYRNYFINRGYLTRIYYINATEDASDMFYSRMDPGYENKRKDTQPDMNHIYANVKTITQYLPNIHYVESAYDFNTTVLHHCLNETKYHPKAEYNLCITRDTQAVAIMSHFKDIMILRPAKTADKDTSFLMDKINGLYASFKDGGSGIEVLDVSMYSFLMDLVGCYNTGVRKLISIQAAVKLGQLVQSELLMLGNGNASLVSPEVLADVIKRTNPTVDISQLKQREYMFNPKYILLEYSSNPATANYFRCMNLVNNQELYTLNEQYFKQTKLLVDWLIR